MDFNKATDGRVAVALVGIYANHLHFAPDRLQCQHLITQFLQVECSFRHPTKNVKALKAISLFHSSLKTHLFHKSSTPYRTTIISPIPLYKLGLVYCIVHFFVIRFAHILCESLLFRSPHLSSVCLSVPCQI